MVEKRVANGHPSHPHTKHPFSTLAGPRWVHSVALFFKKCDSKYADIVAASDKYLNYLNGIPNQIQLCEFCYTHTSVGLTNATPSFGAKGSYRHFPDSRRDLS